MVEAEEQTFEVVTNPEEQYSIWPEERDVPDGWVAVGPAGSKEDCLDYIERVWTDMRPRSLRVETQGSDERTPNEDLQGLVGTTLSQYEERVEEYAGGQPELFGWFLARVLEAKPIDEVDPDAVRGELDRQLPKVH